MTQPVNLLLALIIAIVVVMAVFLVRIDGHMRHLAVSAPPAPVQPAPSVVAKEVVTAKVAGEAGDAQSLIAAMNVLERRSSDTSARVMLLRALRRIDAEAYFREVSRMAASGNPNEMRYALQEDSNEGTLDRRMLPVLKAIIDRSLQGGENGQDWTRLVGQMQRVDPEMAAPYVDEAVRRMLERGDGRMDGDQYAQRLVVSSGVAMGHALVLRSMRNNEYGNNGREQLYLQISDLYQGVRQFGLLVSEKRDQKLSEEDRKQILEHEQWIIANRNLLILDRKTRRMLLAKDEAEADQLRAKQPTAKPWVTEDAKRSAF